MVREAVRRAVRSAVEDAWGKRPIAKVLVTQLRSAECLDTSLRAGSGRLEIAAWHASEPALATSRGR